MTCTHISQARKKLATLVGKLKDSSDLTVYKKTGPYIKPGSVKAWVKDYVVVYKYGANWDTIEPPEISSVKVEAKIDEIDSLLSSCNCFADERVKRESESNRRSDLISHHQEERKNLQVQIDDIKKTYKETTDRQYALIESERRENSLVRSENSRLQKLLGLSEAQVQQLEIRLTEKTNELRLNEQALERLRQVFQELSVSNATYMERSRLVSEQLDWTKDRLEISDERVNRIEGRFEREQQEHGTTKGLLTDLRIKYKTETADKDSELKNKEREIKLLKNQAEKSQKGFLEVRLELKEERMEEFADDLGIDLKQVKKLLGYYESLIDARKNLNQNGISTNENNITEFKQEMLDEGISIKKVKKLCGKCEKAAAIRLELGFKSGSVPQPQTDTNYTNNSYSFNRRERNWKNINPNFTPELVQEWKNHGFTYEECADWVNISSPNQQKQAIKEPDYYAWLRDVKQVDSYWVLNEGNSQKLSQEFFQWYQKQQQSQYQSRQEFPSRNNF